MPAHMEKRNAVRTDWHQKRTPRPAPHTHPPVPPQRSRPLSPRACLPQVYICGGFNGNECLFTAEVYNAESNQWTVIAPMRSRRSGIGVIAYGEHVYAVSPPVPRPKRRPRFSVSEQIYAVVGERLKRFFPNGRHRRREAWHH